MPACPTREEIEAHLRGEPAPPGLADHLAACPRCGARAERARRDLALLAELRDLPVPAGPSGGPVQVPGYRLEGEPLRGGQGLVFRAVQETTRRAVAVKVLSGGRQAGARERRRFEREIELASRLRHPYVVTLFDSDPWSEVPWYAMELVEGQPLDAWARETRPTLRQKVELFARIAAGVAHAHQRGVIHRDLKPANILVDARGEPRILDFGAARESEAGDALRVTATGEFLGTVAYAAPEQLRGQGDEVDTRTDVYALGLVLYELLCGVLPQGHAAGLAEILERSEPDSIAPPSRHDREVGSELDAIVLRALESDPAARYGSAEALAQDLARHLAGEPVHARGHSAWYLLRRQLARRKKSVALAAGAIVAALVGGFAWWREHDRALRQHEQAEVVRSLMQDILAAPGPERMGGDARILDVYEIVAREVDGALGGAPDVQAAVELTVGDTYRRLLRAPEAEPHLRKALERLRQIDDGRELEVARCAYLLGLALTDQNRPDAVLLAEEALAIRERELGPVHPLTAEARRGLALALFAQFRDPDVARARGLLDQALADQMRALGEDHVEVAETRLLRALAPGDLAPEVVEDELLSALDTFDRLAPADPRLITCATAYSSFLQQRSRFEEASALLERATELARAAYGDALATDMLRRHARLEFARGNAVQAEMLSRQAVAHELERWAARRPDEAQELRALAQRVERPGWPTAEPPFAQAFAELRRLEGDGSFELAQWMNGVVLALNAQARGPAGEPILREALQIRCRALGSDCPVRQRSIELLAQVLWKQLRGHEAVPLLEESLATYARRGEEAGSEALAARAMLRACRESPLPDTTAAVR